MVERSHGRSFGFPSNKLSKRDSTEASLAASFITSNAGTYHAPPGLSGRSNMANAPRTNASDGGVRGDSNASRRRRAARRRPLSSARASASNPDDAAADGERVCEVDVGREIKRRSSTVMAR